MEKNIQQITSKVLRIVLYGPESTGKTTLAQALAQHYNTTWVQEYAREYLQNKWDLEKKICEITDLKPIAKGQIEAENSGLTGAKDLIFLDTNLTVTSTYSDIYYGYTEQWLQDLVDQLSYDLYFLTQVDIPWVADDLRDRPENRDQTFKIFEQRLKTLNKPYVVLSGSHQERLTQAIAWTNDLKLAKSMGLSATDLIKIKQYGIQINQLKEHQNKIINGVHSLLIVRPAAINDGIIVLIKEEVEKYAQFFVDHKKDLTILKFVPASGAASRMFQFLSEFINDYKKGQESINAYINRSQNQALAVFLYNKEKFPFHGSLIKHLKENYPTFDDLEEDTKAYVYVETLLTQKPFEYLKKPKAVLPFHQYPEQLFTPIHEHFMEGVHYANNHHKAFIHFTLSENHIELFQSIINPLKASFQAMYQTEFFVEYSVQDKQTDTIAFQLNGLPFYDNNQLIYRPSGHGALIKNLNKIEADVIFIKNIDNVSQKDKKLNETYKKALAGQLLYWQHQIFNYIKILENTTQVSTDLINEVVLFLKEKLHTQLATDFFKYTQTYQIEHLVEKLNRPIRICGMVKNEGEPGGGPFWVKDVHGQISLQIVEKSQIDLSKPSQKDMITHSTHFNPVDLVCSLKNYRGEKFDLNKFIDHEAGFIVQKNKDGQVFSAYELPGLWNGSMAHWISLFIEIPLQVFSPVKTVNDLLKPAHQPK